MDKRYHAIYRDLTESYLATFFLFEDSIVRQFRKSQSDKPYKLIRIAEKIIDDVANKQVLELKLRPDARHSLLVNLHQLLLLPVAHADADIGAPGGVENFDQVVKGLELDISLILGIAEKERENSRKRSITIEHVMRAIVDKSGGLRSSLLNVWG